MQRNATQETTYIDIYANSYATLLKIQDIAYETLLYTEKFDISTQDKIHRIIIAVESKESEFRIKRFINKCKILTKRRISVHKSV